VLTWIAATVAATGLAWAGVRSVVDGVAAPLPAPAVTEAATQAPGERSDPPPDATEPATPRPEPSVSAEDETTVRTFQLTGGTATIRFSPTRVEVVSAVPAPWFTTDVDPAGDTTRVEFESDDHRSRLDVWWDGRPRHEVEEQDQDDHDDDDRDERHGDDDRDDGDDS
jgi:hypothetical protein